jgi:hypothetical protein
MKNILKSTIILCAIVLAGCEKTTPEAKDPLIGTWKLMKMESSFDGGEIITVNGPKVTYIFSEGGTGSLEEEASSSGNRTTGIEWKKDGNTLHITEFLRWKTIAYEIVELTDTNLKLLRNEETGDPDKLVTIHHWFTFNRL